MIWDFARRMLDRVLTARTTGTTTSSTRVFASFADVDPGPAASAVGMGTFEISVCNGDGTPLEQDSFDCDLYDGPHFHIDGRCLGEASSSH